MQVTRRRFLAGLAVAAGSPALVAAQDRSRSGPATRSVPALCLYSKILAKIEYTDLPMVLRGLGFDGCDLSVEPGGHVPPDQAGDLLMPALEAITGAGLEAAAISTPFRSEGDPETREVLGLAGLIGVPLFRPGGWNFAAPGPQLLRRIAGLASVARAGNMATAISNTVEPGGTVPEIEAVIRAFPPRWVGYDFDPAAASARGGSGALDAAFQAAQPRLKMVTARDIRPGASTPCPLGEGIVDWRRVFDLLARAKFTGPISLRIGYQPADELEAIRRDLAFLRKQMGG
jgi:L-ribulose-5-phosphate 3-epimerase